MNLAVGQRASLSLPAVAVSGVHWVICEGSAWGKAKLYDIGPKLLARYSNSFGVDKKERDKEVLSIKRNSNHDINFCAKERNFLTEY